MTRYRSFLPYILVLLATLFISLSGPLGRYADLDPPFVIFIRSCIGVISLYVLNLFIGKEKIVLHLQDKSLVLTGIIMTIHWVLFFYSLKYGTVAVAAVSVFTYPLQTLFIESFVRKKIPNKTYIFSGLLVVLGVWLLNPQFDVDYQYFWGIVFGLMAGTFLAIRNVLSKNILERYTPLNTYFNQVLIASFLLIPFAWRETFEAMIDQWIPLLLLGLLTTSLGHMLMMKSLQHFSAGEVGLLVSGQPVSAIIFGYFLLGEVPGNMVYAGATCILLAVILSFLKITPKNTG
ncbi:MAG: DMT family transporter [Saprospiraceae bacterium]|nr:DMT family transporter [Saprospiraceae bacterium]